MMPESSRATITTTRVLAELAAESAREKGMWIRLARVDGTFIEGPLLGVEPTHLTVMDSASGTPTKVDAGDLATLYVRTARRGREWMLAGVAIVGATLALIGYASLPWVEPDGDIDDGFRIIFAAGAALLTTVLARTGLRRWLTAWRPLYPPGS